MVLRQGDEVSTLSGQESKTTANRLQLLAAARALSAAQGDQSIHVHTPSDYVQRGASQWLDAWQRRLWKTRSGQPVKNRDLWQEIADACEANKVRWHLASSGTDAQEIGQAYELACEAASS